MIYFFLYILFVLFFVLSFKTTTENKTIAAIMGWLLFLLVAFRSQEVGPDTFYYVQFFLNKNFNIEGNRQEMERLFLGWNEMWRSFNFGGQMYIIVCAIASVGLVLYSMWKESKQRVWTFALFLFMFSWYFYLSGIRQAISMGCFTFGTYLLCRDNNLNSFKNIINLFKKRNIIALILVALSPFFHTSAIFAVAVFLLAILSPKNRQSIYIWGITISFAICLTAVFKDAEIWLKKLFDFVNDDYETAGRYAGYIEQDYLYDTSLYLVLKSALPLNFIALFSLFICKRDYNVGERTFFWLVIISNLFFYFPYMFRINMYLYPASCVAITNMIWPKIKNRTFNFNHVLYLIFMLLTAYVSYVNLSMLEPFKYRFFF